MDALRTLKEFFIFAWKKRLFFLFPLIALIIVIGILFLLSSPAAPAPFIYVLY